MKCALILLALLGMVACGGQPTTTTPTTPTKPLTTVVFLGDSLTHGFYLDVYFPGKDYINKGIEGEATADLLARFQADVIALHPDAVMIWAGTNDAYNQTAPTTTEANLETMYASARAAGIVPIACTITPATGSRGAASNATIVTVNAWIRQYAAAQGITVADYYPAAVDANGHAPCCMAPTRQSRGLPFRALSN